MKNNLKVFFGYTQLMAVVYYRFLSFAKYMRKIKGVEVAYSKKNNYDNQVFNWQNHLDDRNVLGQVEMLMSTADVTVLGIFNNLMGVALMQAIKEKYKKPILTEIDDYVFTLPAYNMASNVYRPGNDLEWIIQQQLRNSDGLIVSTNSLKKQYEPFNKNIYVVANGVDLEVWDTLSTSPKKSDKIRIGFTGSPNHSGDIRMIKEPIMTILEKYPNVEFYFKGCCPDIFPKNDRIILDNNFVIINQFPQALKDANFDIGIAPLKDNNFNRGKSNLRWLELSMLKVPCVASPEPAYLESIKDGKTGFIADTKKQWVLSLSNLIESVTLRKNIGVNAYNDVRKNHNVKDRAKEYVDILNEVKKWTEKT